MAAEKDPQSLASEPRSAGPELRLLDRRAFVGFPPMDIGPGVRVTDFALQIPDVTFPFNITGGPQRYQKKKLHFGYLDVTIDAEQVQRKVMELSGRIGELEGLKLHFRAGYLEGQAKLRGPEATPVTFKVAFDGDGERLAVYLYDVRLYGFSSTPSAQVPVVIGRALQGSGLLPDVDLRGATGFSARVLPPLCQAAAVARGFKVPVLDGARLSGAEISPQGLKLRFSAGGLPPPAPPDEELMLTLEGARAFAEAEELLSRGKLVEARDAYLRHGDVQDAHPFAAERLLSLLVADPQAHEMALDVAASLQRRRERSAAALWAEAVVRERRGENARAAERYLTLCGLARRGGEESAAFFAAESAARVAREQAPQMAVKALHELLGLRPDHLPSLQALARAADQANDRAGAARAYRRIAALARDPVDAAEAHVHLARLSALAEDDIAGARLHCEAALRLSPDHPEALYLLGELCHRSGEHLRALKALDRLRDVGLGRHELDRVGRAHLLAGQVWEVGLAQLENALLRYREAVSLLPHAPEPLFRVARVAEALGRTQEALAGYQQTVELAGPAPRSDEIRRAAHGAHHALARLQRTQLQDPVQARAHLEAALALDPRDAMALEQLVPAFRAAGRSAELADALEKSAALTDEWAKRAALFAEAGELYRARLGQPEKAERLLQAAVDADPRQRVAWEGILNLAEARRDGPGLTRALKALAELTSEPGDRARYLRRLAVTARDLTFDLELAAFALSGVLELEPDDLAALGELCALQRKRGDVAGLAKALEQRAAAAEKSRDLRLAAAALRELAQVLEARLGRVGEALVALEKAARLAPDAAVLSDLADLSLRCDRPEHARKALEDLLALLPKHAAPERVAEVRARLGRASEQLGDRVAARRYYADAFPLRRLDDALAARLEALYAEDGHDAELGELWAARADALVAAGRAAAAAPLLLKSAEALLALGKKDAGLVKLGAALDAAPEGPLAGEILERMAEVSLQGGTPLDAAKLYARKAAITRDAKQAALLFWKAAGLASNSAREDAYLEDALAKDPELFPARIRRADRAIANAPARALDELERVLAAPPAHPHAPLPEERAWLLRRAADAAVRSGRPDRALAHLARFAAEHPEDLSVQRELAKLLEREGHDEARCDLLAELWPRLSGDEAETVCRDFCELALKLGREPEAFEALRALLRSEAHGSWAARTLLEEQPADESEDPEARLALLSRVLDDAGQKATLEWLLERAGLLEGLGQRSAARADYARAAERSPEPASLWAKVAALSEAQGDVGQELTAWEKGLAADASLADAAQPRLLALASERLIARDASRARAAFLLLAKLPLPLETRQEVFLGLAEAAQLEGDRPAAIDALREAAEQGPPARRLAARLDEAALLEEDDRWPEVVTALEAALRLSPGNPRATQALMRALRAQEDFTGLAELLASQARLGPKSEAAALHEELAHLYLDVLEQPGPAEAAFAKVAALDPKRADVRGTLTHLAMGRGAVAEAVEHAQAAAALLPADEAMALLLDVAKAAESSGDWERARALWRAAHAKGPLRGDALAEWSLRLFGAGAWDEAAPLLAAAARQTHADVPEQIADVLQALSEVTVQRGDRQAAERALERLHELRPEDLGVTERLAELRWVDRPREAVELLREQAKRMRNGGQAAALLVGLSGRVRRELSDVDLAASLLATAAEVAFDPLPVRDARISLLRETGRIPELLAELTSVAELRESTGDVAGAMETLLERAAIAESSGRVDDALRTLEQVAARLESSGDRRQASRVERRRAELLRDARQDLQGAEAALSRSDALEPLLETAQIGAALAEQRRDFAGRVRWLERTAERTLGKERARALLALARALSEESEASASGEAWPERADAVTREALFIDPDLREAEALLAERLERSGRLEELAVYYEEASSRTREKNDRVALLVRAAEIYATRLGKADAAAAALLAAHGTAPDDLALTARAADVLHAAGRAEEAAEFDALLLEKDPFHPVGARYQSHLEKHQDHAARAAWLLRQAAAQEGAAAARSYLDAAAAFRAAGAEQQALLSEDQAFEQDPKDAEAFAAARARHANDVRQLAEVLARRAEVVPEEAEALLRERAQRLSAAGEQLAAAAALDDLLRIVPDDVVALIERGDLAAAGSGPQAAQPFDRRALGVGGDRLPAAARLRLQLRVGHASLLSGALRDAADAFEAVVALDPDGDKGEEALSLLGEVHAKTQDVPGLYRTTLVRARRAQADEAEALYRRAAELFADPAEGVDAWRALVALRPADATVVEPATRALRATRRFGELVDVLERSAEAIGGGGAAEQLLEAASIAERELADPDRARALKALAFRADPENSAALHSVVEDARLRGDAAALRDALTRLLPKASDRDEEALWRLELASAAQQTGDDAAARDALWPVVRWGRTATGYVEALDALLPLLHEGDDPAGLADVLAQRAELANGVERANLLLRAAGVYERLGRPDDAVRLTQAAVSGHPSLEGFELLARLYRAAGDPARAGQALRQAARLSEGEARGRHLLEAAEAFDAAGEQGEALESTEEAARVLGDTLPRRELAARYRRLGAPAQALEVGFASALAAGDLDDALALATAANDAGRVSEVLAAEAVRGEGARAARLIEERLAAQDADGLWSIARLLEEASAMAPAERAWEELAFPASLAVPIALRQTALDRLLSRREPLALLQRGLAQAEETPEWRDVLLARARQRGPEVLRGFLSQAVDRPGAPDALLAELAKLQEQAEDWASAIATLTRAVEAAPEPARGSVHLRIARLREKLGEVDAARIEYARALEDPGLASEVAPKLLALAAAAGPDALISTADLVAQQGETRALEPHRAALAEAYESAGRLAEASRLLSELEPTEERLERRARLAETLGLSGEALTLREQLTEDPRALEQILLGYLVRDLHPPAVRLAQRLLDNGALTPRAHHAAAERLSRSPEGAALATKLWPPLLREKPVDPDGWTLYAEALRRVDRTDAASRADGMGAALTGSQAASAQRVLKPVVRGPQVEANEVPPDVVPLTVETMPRLAHAMATALEGLGAPELRAVLDPRGGAEAWVAAPDTLVVGAGALARFGAAELAYLCALALALGNRSASLREGATPIEATELAAAVAAAFRGAPDTLAAARVVATLEPSLRGADPSRASSATVLRESALFVVLARAALELD